MNINNAIMDNKYFPYTQVRMARPTDRFIEVIRFYTEGLGLPEIGRFHDHQGFSGIMLGLPGDHHHLEFTTHQNGSPCPAPTPDNLLVFYLRGQEERDVIVQRLKAMGYDEVAPHNPYWGRHGITIEDPDGWRVVLMETEGFRE